MNFDLEAIFGLLFVIFFVVVPIFSKRKKGPPPGQPRQPGGPPQAPRAGGPPVAPGSERGGATASSAPPASAQQQQAPAGSLQATLDEIRKRVQEAQQQEQGRTQTGRATPSSTQRAQSTQQSVATPSGPQAPSSADQFGSGMFSGPRSTPGSSPQPTGSQPSRGAAARPATSAPLGREGRVRSATLDSAAQLEVSKTKRAPRRSSRHTSLTDAVPARRDAVAGETKLSSALLGTTRADLVRGMIWHEILAEPVAHKRRRRIKSRPR